MHGKYLIIRIDGKEVPLVFPDFPCPVTHKQIALAFPNQVIAAGYCCLETWAAFGEGISINLKSRGPEDTLLLFTHFSGANAATISSLQAMLDRPQQSNRKPQ